MKLMKLSAVSLDDQQSFDEAGFFSADKYKHFLQFDSITLSVCVCVCVCVTRHAQITQNSKFVIS